MLNQIRFLSTTLCPLRRDAFRLGLASSHTECRAAQCPHVFSCETALSLFASFPPSHTMIAQKYAADATHWVVNDLLPNQIRIFTIRAWLRKNIDDTMVD